MLDSTKVVRTFNCPKCDGLYWAFLPNELSWFDKLSSQQQDEFVQSHLNDHLSLCYVARRN